MKHNPVRTYVITLTTIVLLASVALASYAYISYNAPSAIKKRPKIFEDITWPTHDTHANAPFDTDMDGIDISCHQGRIMWEDMKQSSNRPKFIYTRVMRKGGGYDECYDNNILGAHQAGIPVGSYVFYSHEVSATEHFNRFTYMVDPDEQDLIPMIDIEEASISTGGTKHLRDSVLMLAHLLEQYYGKKPVIYSNQRFYEKHLKHLFDHYPLWIANYSRQPSLSTASHSIYLWQRSESGHVQGVWTSVDIDCFVNGHTVDELMLHDKKKDQ